MELAPSRLAPGDVLRVGAVGLSRAQAARRALRPRDRDRHRRDGRGPRDLRVEQGRPPVVARPARHEPAHRLARGSRSSARTATLPDSARAMVRRIGPVEAVSATGSVSTPVYRSELIPSAETKGHHDARRRPVAARDGRRHARRRRLPRRRVGPVPRRRPGIDGRPPARHRPGRRRGPGRARRSGGSRSSGSSTRSRWRPGSTPRRSSASRPRAGYLDDEGDVASLYVRSDPEDVDDVQSVLALTASPEHPDEVDVSRPSDAIEARAAAKSAFTSLFLGLGAVALLVGGVGIANVMVISVLERRSEIGLRRALGATRRHLGDPVPHRVAAALARGRDRGRRARRRGRGGVRVEPGLGGRRAAGRARGRGACSRCGRRGGGSLPGAPSGTARAGRRAQVGVITRGGRRPRTRGSARARPRGSASAAASRGRRGRGSASR